MRKSLIIMFCFAGLCAVPAVASSDDAWQELATNARKACTKKIESSSNAKWKVKVTKVTGTVMGIGGSDGDLYYAVTLAGISGRQAERWLCLYDKRTKKVQASIFDMTN